MTKPKTTKASTAEYFALQHVRSRPLLTTRAKQYDCEPERVEERQNFFRAYWQKRDPNWRPGQDLDRKFEHFSYRPPADLVPKFSCFRADVPDGLSGFERLHVFGYYDIYEHYEATVDIVSETWRAAVEAEDPGVHHFYPHDLRFKSREIRYYIFLHGAESDCVVFERSDSRISERGTFYLNECPKYLTAQRSALSPQSYQHFRASSPVPYPRAIYPLIRASLADRLRPLIPRTMRLLPVSVTE